MIYLSRPAPLQSSGHSYSRGILPLQVHLKSICPRQHFAPRVIAQRAQSQAEEIGLGSHRAGGVTQNILAGSPPQAWDMAISNRCDSSCQGFGPHHHHHHHSTSTLWVTGTLHLFFLIKIKGSHSHVQAVLFWSVQYGNKVIEWWGYSSSHGH